MSEQRPIDWEATAARAVTGVMILSLAILATALGLRMFGDHIGDPRTLLHRDWTDSAGLILSGLVISLSGAQFTWFALKQLLRLPERIDAPKTPTPPISREDLIRTAPWVDRFPTAISRRSIIEGIAFALVVAGLVLLAWRLPEPTRGWVWLLLLATLAVCRLVEWAWKAIRKAR